MTGRRCGTAGPSKELAMLVAAAAAAVDRSPLRAAAR